MSKMYTYMSGKQSNKSHPSSIRRHTLYESGRMNGLKACSHCVVNDCVNINIPSGNVIAIMLTHRMGEGSILCVKMPSIEILMVKLIFELPSFRNRRGYSLFKVCSQ